jgi:hypothetical protein
MKKTLILLTLIAFLLGGCSWMDGSYLSVKPHMGQNVSTQAKVRTAANYLQLRTALEEMVDSGVENAVINVADYRVDLLEEGVASAALYTERRYPLGAYAVEDISYEIGTSGGVPAVLVNISYIHGRSEIRTIKKADDMTGVKELVTEAVAQCSNSVVVLVKHYEAMDFQQLVEDYMRGNPNIVMELPQAAVGIYPDAGSSRIVEVKFTYETSRDSLRLMQQQVQRIFASAQLYINSDATTAQKCAQLYTFLMERFDYTMQTSITPFYSLLNHGVGDQEAFATVYAAMCNQAGLDCSVVSGTRNGKSWYWNIVQEDGVNYHIDLLSCSETGDFRWLTDDQMEGYVWDYTAYAAPLPEETEPAPTETVPDPTE